MLRWQRKVIQRECKSELKRDNIAVCTREDTRQDYYKLNNARSRQTINKGTSYRKGWGTREQVFILLYIIERSIKWQGNMYLNFMDFEATDSIHRESLWAVMRKNGIPEKIVKMVKAYFDSFRCVVVDRGDIYE